MDSVFTIKSAALYFGPHVRCSKFIETKASNTCHMIQKAKNRINMKKKITTIA